MTDTPMTPRELSGRLRRELGLSPGYASDLAHGRRTPSLALAHRIEAAIGVPVASWHANVRAAA